MNDIIKLKAISIFVCYQFVLYYGICTALCGHLHVYGHTCICAFMCKDHTQMAGILLNRFPSVFFSNLIDFVCIYTCVHVHVSACVHVCLCVYVCVCTTTHVEIREQLCGVESHFAPLHGLQGLNLGFQASQASIFAH